MSERVRTQARTRADKAEGDAIALQEKEEKLKKRFVFIDLLSSPLLFCECRMGWGS
jgi:hypothetical protein